MRVWVISSSYPREPAESINAGVIAADLAVTLAEDGHDVTVFTPDKPGGVRFDDRISGVTLPWVRPTLALADLSPRSPLDVIRMASLMVGARRTLRRALQSDRPDGVIALWALPSGIFARWVSRWTDTPYVVWLLGSDVWKARRFPRGKRIFTNVVQDAAATFADGTDLAREGTAISGRAVGFLPSCRRLPAPPDGALPAPVDVLFVGRYHPNKGPDVLLEAFAILRRRRPGVTLRMCGLGDMRGQLERRASELGLDGDGSIEGPVSASQLSAAMATAKVLVIPSRVESIPLILGDALQARIPVVASAVGDLPEVVDRYGLGRTVPPEDPEALAAALEETVTSPRRIPEGAGPDWLTPSGLADALIRGLT